jgi:hypothetical protein
MSATTVTAVDEESESGTGTFAAVDVISALKAASSVASRDAKIPTMCTVALSVDRVAGGTVLTAAGTDRHRLVVAQTSREEREIPTSWAMIAATEAASVAAMLTRSRRTNPSVTVTVSITDVAVTFAHGETSVAVPRMLEGHFPAVHKFMPSSPTVDVDGPRYPAIGFNPDFLASAANICKLFTRGRLELLEIRLGASPSKPVVFAAGNDGANVRCLLMPVRLPDVMTASQWRRAEYGERAPTAVAAVAAFAPLRNEPRTPSA